MYKDQKAFQYFTYQRHHEPVDSKLKAIRRETFRLAKLLSCKEFHDPVK